MDEVEKLKMIKQYIENNLNKEDLEKSYHDYEINPRLDDCFEGGYDKGYSFALYKIGRMLGIYY